MNADIGNLGEDDFVRLCTSADLIASRPKKDKYGWDFLVEFPFNNNLFLPLDSQLPSIKCMVQIKSTRKNSGSFQIKLSAMLGLVQAQMPSFVCFFIYNTEDNIQDIYLVHIDKDIIESVLKSVRKNEVKNKPLHKVQTTIHYREEDKLEDINGLCLKDTINNYVPIGMNGYIERKNRLINSVGFDDSTFSITMNFKNITHNDLIDMSLGLKEDIPVEISKMMQKRFNIEMPFDTELNRASDVKVSIKPQAKQVTLLIKQSEYANPLEYKVNLYTSPFNRKENSKILLQNDMFELFLDFLNDNHKFKFNFKAEKKYLMKDLFNILKLFDFANDNQDTSLLMRIKGAGFPNDTFFSFTISSLEAEQMLFFFSSLKELMQIYSKLELDNNTYITLQELGQNSSQINAIYQLLYEDVTKMTTTFSTNQNINSLKLNIDKSIHILPFSMVVDDKIMGAFIVFISEVEKVKEYEYKCIPFKREIKNIFIAEHESFDANFYDDTYQKLSDEFKEQDIHIVITTNQYIKVNK